MALPYAKIILDRLKEELKPRGFKKSGQTFVKAVNDCYQIVNLQASQWGTSGDQSYTINFAVYSTLLEPLEKEAMKLKQYEGHWGARIGDFTYESRDKWWDVKSGEDANSAAEAMLAVVPLALEAMDGISTYEAILRIPPGSGSTTDDPPGHCRTGLINAAREREGLPPHPSFRHGDGWRDSWHQRNFPNYVPPEPEADLPETAVAVSTTTFESAPGWTFIRYERIAPMVDADE